MVGFLFNPQLNLTSLKNEWAVHYFLDSRLGLSYTLIIRW